MPLWVQLKVCVNHADTISSTQTIFLLKHDIFVSIHVDIHCRYVVLLLVCSCCIRQAHNPTGVKFSMEFKFCYFCLWKSR